MSTKDSLWRWFVIPVILGLVGFAGWVLTREPDQEPSIASPKEVVEKAKESGAVDQIRFGSPPLKVDFVLAKKKPDRFTGTIKPGSPIPTSVHRYMTVKLIETRRSFPRGDTFLFDFEEVEVSQVIRVGDDDYVQIDNLFFKSLSDQTTDQILEWLDNGTQIQAFESEDVLEEYGND